jgi:tRNA pseudouridine(38-40) synthase
LRVALGLSYNGSSYEGWQSQLSGNTIQDRLEHALGQFTAQQFRVNCAGRTDAGVHGLMQVVHFRHAARARRSLVGARHQCIFAARHCRSVGAPHA